jgi:hypothetical protein
MIASTPAPCQPGTILGIIALIVALSGSVYAASSLPNGSVTGAKIKNGSIGLNDLSTAAKKALRGAAGPAGAVGATGAAGAAGAPGTARAFGFVSSAGILNPARSKNLTVTKVTDLGQPGTYCVTPTAAGGVTPASAMPVVTADFTDGNGLDPLAQLNTSGTASGSCPNGWMVMTRATSAASAWPQVPPQAGGLAPHHLAGGHSRPLRVTRPRLATKQPSASAGDGSRAARGAARVASSDVVYDLPAAEPAGARCSPRSCARPGGRPEGPVA